MAFTILETLIVALGCCAASAHCVHILQMRRYQLPGYRLWLNQNRDRILKGNVLPSFGVAMLSLYLPFFLSMFVTGEETRRTLSKWLVLVLFIGMSGFIAWRDYTRPSKKPLVLTHRVRRFAAVLLALNLLIAVLMRLLTMPVYFLFAGVPYLVLLTAMIVNPYETRLNAGYFKSARQKIRRRKGLITIGITGSYGKTNVKFMLRDILSRKYNVLATPASFNTAMGISRVINDDLNDAHQVFIAEMGATHVGDIKELVDLVRPKYGILTSIGPRHLDTFGSLANIASTKYELIEGLPEDGIAVFGSGDDYIDRLYAMCGKDKCRVSLDPEAPAYLRAEGIAYSARGTSFTMVCEDGEQVECRTPLLGSYNVRNILLASALARKLGLEMAEIAQAVSTLQPMEHRLQLIPEDDEASGGLNMIDDALNEDPDGAFEAVRVLAHMPGCRILVTPGLCTLGDKGGEINYALGTVVADCADAVILVGAENVQRSLRRGLLQSGFSRSDLHMVDDMDVASDVLGEISVAGDTVLFESHVADENE